MTPKNWMMLGLLAASLAVSCSHVSAQNRKADPDAIDYSVLTNQVYDYADLKVAKARNFSDMQTATIAKIAELSGMKFRTISEAVQRGVTFAALAEKYNLSFAELKDIQKEKDEIAAYESAYETTGKMGQKRDSRTSMIPG